MSNSVIQPVGARWEGEKAGLSPAAPPPQETDPILPAHQPSFLIVYIFSRRYNRCKKKRKKKRVLLLTAHDFPRALLLYAEDNSN